MSHDSIVLAMSLVCILGLIATVFFTMFIEGERS